MKGGKSDGGSVPDITVETQLLDQTRTEIAYMNEQTIKEICEIDQNMWGTFPCVCMGCVIAPQWLSQCGIMNSVMIECLNLI